MGWAYIRVYRETIGYGSIGADLQPAQVKQSAPSTPRTYHPHAREGTLPRPGGFTAATTEQPRAKRRASGGLATAAKKSKV